FPKPENGAELAWNAYRRYQGPRDFLARPTYLLFSKSGKLERSFINFFFKKFFTNRGDVPPVPEIPGNNGEISVKIAMLILEPFDVKGFSFIRTVYEDIYKNDDVFSYLPALRRIRRLTGKDVCDPVLGSDSIYDDFENWQGKIKPGMKFRILGTKDFLTPAYITEPLHVVKGKSFQIDWEIRPLDLLEIQMNDPEHVYLKRIFYMDNESRMGITYYADGYDMKGRLWRGGTCGNVQYIEPGHWIQNWVTGIYRDQLTGHSSVLDFDLVNSVLHEVRIPMEWFTVRGLLKQCR
ncbi:MAG: DUF1329 domain-containing protein, partial [Thermodesulfobacteriota bacterium]|nr:DUF1329 domain-containing protein [Thermodesulfobacteriota bacterium]